MKAIKLKSESQLFQDHHFIVTEFLGQETVGFYYTEKEFVNRSVYYALYGTDFEELPIKRGETDEVNDSKHIQRNAVPALAINKDKEKYTDKTCFCPADFYIASDKGGRGYNSIFSVFACHVENTNDEYIVTITAAADNEVIARITEAFGKEHYTVGRFFSEHLTVNLEAFSALANDIVRCAEETVFLDLEEQLEYRGIPVTPHGDGYSIKADDYKPVNGNDNIPNTVDEGDYIYTKPMRNVVEILRIEHFAHSLYAKFYAVAKSVLVYPRDKAEIQDRFPGFYLEHCVSHSEQEKNRLTRGATSVPYIPESNQLGDTVIYRKLSFSSMGSLIESGLFHMITGEDSFVGVFNNGIDNRLRTNERSLNASLIQVGDKFKIMLYEFDKVVKYNGEYYGRFKYNDESEFFTDFCDITIKPSPYIQRNRMAYKGIEYLLYKGDIKPIQISRERYEEFKRTDK